MENIKIVCKQEDKVIGTIGLEPGKHRVDSPMIRDKFVPVEQRYRYKQLPRDGSYLKCPFCDGHCVIVADHDYIDHDEKRKREEATPVEVILGQMISVQQ